MRVYMCGPMTGLTLDEAVALRKPAMEALAECGVECLSPLRGKNLAPDLRADVIKAKGYESVLVTDKAIVSRDRNDVLRCDVVLADFRGAGRVSIGSCVEFGWADAFRKPIVTVMDKDGNPHDHGFIHQLSTYVVHDMDEAVQLVITLLNV